MLGIVTDFDSQRGLGHLIDESGTRRFFPTKNVLGHTLPNAGSTVSFEPFLTHSEVGGAASLRVISVRSSVPLLNEVSEWKLEAKLEDSLRYFYQTDDVDAIEAGIRCYVIGRKGTGKTAIAEHLLKKSEPHRFGRKLSFKYFPFNDLYTRSNDRYTPPNQYITLWKYLIYCSIAEMMAGNENIESGVRLELERLYRRELHETLEKRVSRWTSRSFELKVIGSGVSVGLERGATPNEAPWIQRVAFLEDLILRHLDDARYFVIFDELDEDYKNLATEGAGDQYSALLTSLFKAVQDIKAVFRPPQHNILPVIFLRDDIYETVRDPDRTKWSDLLIELDWKRDKMQRLLRFRLSRALDPEGKILPFDEAWASFFVPEPILYSSNKQTSTFSFISNSTLSRPRDFVRYLRDCALGARLKGAPFVTPYLIKQANAGFSDYLRSEFEDELREILPDIHEILNALGAMQKMYFRGDDFSRVVRGNVDSGKMHHCDPGHVLEILFRFSILGSLSGSQKPIFRYLDKGAMCNPKGVFCVHRGLCPSLHII
jgi:hypothetical protein